jgi:hypothetical protein
MPWASHNARTRTPTIIWLAKAFQPDQRQLLVADHNDHSLGVLGNSMMPSQVASTMAMATGNSRTGKVQTLTKATVKDPAHTPDMIAQASLISMQFHRTPEDHLTTLSKRVRSNVNLVLTK